jgi:uncharacterized protein (DUF885 family)
MTVDRRDFLRLGAAAVAGVAASGVLEGCKVESRRELADDSFLRLRDDYFRDQLRRNPVTSTYLGGDGWDQSLRDLNGRLRDYSPDALKDEAEEYFNLDRAHNSIDASLLSTHRRIDHTVIGAQMAFLKQQLDRRYHERAVDTYVAEPFRGVDWQIQQMRTFSGGRLGDEAEWRLVVQRVSAIPAYLTVARANLEAGRKAGNVADQRMIQTDGIAGSRANAAYFRDTLPALARRYLGDQSYASSMSSGIAGAAGSAAKAYDDFAGWLERNFRSDRTDRFALGEAAYEWRLRTVFRDERSASDLFEYGARQVEEYTNRMAEVAERIARERGIVLPFNNPTDRA